MKQRLLIVEPSEVIIEGLKAILEGQIRFKVLEPELDVKRLDERRGEACHGLHVLVRAHASRLESVLGVRRHALGRVIAEELGHAARKLLEVGVGVESLLTEVVELLADLDSSEPRRELRGKTRELGEHAALQRVAQNAASVGACGA